LANSNLNFADSRGGATYDTYNRADSGFYKFSKAASLEIMRDLPGYWSTPAPFYGLMRERLCTTVFEFQILQTLGAEPHGSYNRADSGFYIT